MCAWKIYWFNAYGNCILAGGVWVSGFRSLGPGLVAQMPALLRTGLSCVAGRGVEAQPVWRAVTVTSRPALPQGEYVPWGSHAKSSWQAEAFSPRSLPEGLSQNEHTPLWSAILADTAEHKQGGQCTRGWLQQLSLQLLDPFMKRIIWPGACDSRGPFQPTPIARDLRPAGLHSRSRWKEP